MRVSELAQLAGVTAKAVRFYESEGILPPAPRADNGYREYAEADLCRLRIVVALRSLGLALGDSGRLAALCTDGRCDEMGTELTERLADRRREVAATRAELDHLDAELMHLQEALASNEPVAGLCLQEGADLDPLRRLSMRA